MSAQLCKDVWVFVNKCGLGRALGPTSSIIIIIIVIVIIIFIIIIVIIILIIP